MPPSSNSCSVTLGSYAEHGEVADVLARRLSFLLCADHRSYFEDEKLRCASRSNAPSIVLILSTIHKMLHAADSPAQPLQGGIVSRNRLQQC